MNLTPPMDPNAAPLDTIHKPRRMVIAMAFCVLLFLWAGISVSFSPGLQLICFAIVALTLLYSLFFDIQKVEFFPTYVSINSILRKRRIERADIDFVSMETTTRRVYGIPVSSNYVRVKLRSGRKIDLYGFQEGVYAKLKACESTNEEFLRGR
jgi:hypothetical protein